VLELQAVAHFYRSAAEEVRAVDGVTLRVKAGEMLALQGPSGSGKTTLLMLIAALLRPDEGTIRFDDQDLGSLSERDAADYLLHDVGFIYQRFHLMPGVSALENASLGLLLTRIGVRESQAIAQSWLERVGLANRLKHTPEQLSGGERQRVAIARALAGEPRLILADEPTGSLDSTRSQAIIELLRSIAHDRQAAIVVVTHDADVAALADRRAILRDGRLSVEDAPADGARTRPPSSPVSSHQG
jgi:putative ABC transport system ATP-binding protein